MHYGNEMFARFVNGILLTLVYQIYVYTRLKFWQLFPLIHAYLVLDISKDNKTKGTLFPKGDSTFLMLSNAKKHKWVLKNAKGH